jgi:hypothetical protein
MATEGGASRDGGRPGHAAPDRSVGRGPFARLVLRDVTVVDGTGSPPQGPVDIVVEHNRIRAVHLVASPQARMQEAERPRVGDDGLELDLAGHYVLPGLFDCHGHIGSPERSPSAQYVYDLWLAHGVTSVRDPGCLRNGLAFTAREAERSARNEIVAPRIWPYVVFGEGRQAPFVRPDEARAWVAGVAERGAQGIKFFGYRADVMRAALEEARVLQLGSACHHSQTYVAQVNALTSARWGLSSVEHWYGLPEALFVDRRFQDFPVDYNYEDEQQRFYESGRLWRQAAEPGSRRWQEVIDELVALGVTLDPTFQVYDTNRDVSRAQTFPWHSAYTAPQLWDFWKPGRERHGSVFYDWTTEMEVAWRHNFQRWMHFVRDYLHRGGRVTTGTDAGNAYRPWGFASVAEMELLREAGMHPLEVVHSATLAAAELVGADDVLGSIAPGKLADLVVVPGNPLANLKLLYGIGHLRLDAGGGLERTGGVRLTIKDGIVYSAAELLERARDTVAQARAERGQLALEALP